MTTYYIATPAGQRSSNGYLVADGEAFTARSGGFKRGNVPEGTYKLGPTRDLDSSKKQDKSMSPGGKGWRKYKKFGISGVGPKFSEGELKDKRYATNRDGVRLHYDGRTSGTEGCIGYDSIETQEAIQRAYAKGDRDIQVIHAKNDADARAQVKALTGKDAPKATRPDTYDRPWKQGEAGGAKRKPRAKSKAKPKRKRRSGRRTADVSRIKHGAKMADGERSIMLGKKRLVAAHVNAPHTGGGKVAQGSPTVFVGRQRLAFGRVDDRTTDGSQLATGEDSVMVG